MKQTRSLISNKLIDKLSYGEDLPNLGDYRDEIKAQLLSRAKNIRDLIMRLWNMVKSTVLKIWGKIFPSRVSNLEKIKKKLTKFKEVVDRNNSFGEKKDTIIKIPSIFLNKDFADIMKEFSEFVSDDLMNVVENLKENKDLDYQSSLTKLNNFVNKIKKNGTSLTKVGINDLDFVLFLSISTIDKLQGVIQHLDNITPNVEKISNKEITKLEKSTNEEMDVDNTRKIYDIITKINDIINTFYVSFLDLMKEIKTGELNNEDFKNGFTKYDFKSKYSGKYESYYISKKEKLITKGERFSYTINNIVAYSESIKLLR